MRLARELPTSGKCALSGIETTDTIDFVLSCDVPCVQPPYGSWWASALSVLIGLIIPMKAAWISFAASSLSTTLVKQAIVKVPLRLDRRHLTEVRTLDNGKLHQLLRSEPIYCRLLDEHPYLEASIES